MRALALATFLLALVVWPCTPAPPLFVIEFESTSMSGKVELLEQAVSKRRFMDVVQMTRGFEPELGSARRHVRRVQELQATAQLALGQFASAVTTFDMLVEQGAEPRLEFRRAEARVRWAEATEDVEALKTLQRMGREGVLDPSARLAVIRAAVRAGRKDEARLNCDELHLEADDPKALEAKVCQGTLPRSQRSRFCGKSRAGVTERGGGRRAARTAILTRRRRHSTLAPFPWFSWVLVSTASGAARFRCDSRRIGASFHEPRCPTHFKGLQ